MSLLRMLLMANTPKDYIKFADPIVEKICAENWGDGTGITYAQAARVKTLGNKFQGNTEITSFDELQYFGCTTIGNDEFNGCTALNEIILPDIVTKIGDRSFKNTLIMSIDCKNCNVFGDYVFQNCLNLITAKILQLNPNSISTPKYLFYNCQNLQSAELGKVINVPQGLFRDCKSFNVPDGFFDDVLSIGADAFWGSGININNLYLPKCTIIGGSAFRNCKGIAGDLSMPNLEKISDFALNGLSINTITSLGKIETDGSNGAISNYPYLKKVIMPDSFATTEWVLLCDCPLLETVEFGPNLNNINGNMLSNCKALKTLIIKTNTPPLVKYPNLVLKGPTPSTVNIYVPDEAIEQYKIADFWIDRANYIKPLSEYVPEA